MSVRPKALFLRLKESDMTTQTSRLVIEIDSRNAERNTRAVANELENLTIKGIKADTQMTEMSSSIKSLVGYMGGLLTINKAIAMADGYTQMAARIRNATTSAEEYTLVQDRLLANANTTYRQLGEAQEVYLSMAGGMRSLGKTTKDTLDLTDSLSFSFTHNATRIDQAQSAMDALSKSMAKGKVDSDAWISIVTGADNVIADMAKTTGKTEAEIRKLGAEGKVSLEDLIKTLIATREQNEKLANNMENSLADGFTTLSTAVTVYLGKANESTSATGVMAGALGELAKNIESVANVAMLGGVAYLTKTILTQTVAIRGSIATSVVARASSIANTNAKLAEAVANHNLAKSELTATATMVKSMGVTNAQTTAMMANARAKYQSSAASLTLAQSQVAANATASVGARAFSLIGGPIGALTIGVTALTAGYMYFSNRTAEANQKLAEQASVAKQAKEELLALKGLEKDSAINDMASAFERQNKALSESSSKINMQLNAIEQLYKGNKDVAQVVQDARNGTISMTDAVQRFNELRISKEVYESVKENTTEFEKNAKEATNTKAKLNLFGIEVELAGKKAQTAVAGLDENSKALKGNKSAAEDATKAQKDFKASLFDRDFEAHLTKGLLAKGYSPEQVKSMVDTATWARKNNVKISNDLYQIGLQTLSIEQQNNKVIEARNKSLKDNTIELTKQQKVLQTSSQVQANASKYNFGGLESKYNLPSGMLSALHAIETGNTGKTNQVNKQTGATGGFQFLKGTAQQYGVNDRTDMSQSAEGAAKYMSYLLKLFKGDLEKAVRAYHAGEGNVQKGKNIGKYNNDYWQKFKGYSAGVNGYSAGDISTKDFEKILEEATKLSEEQANSRKSLELEVASEVTKIRESLKDKLLEIDKAGFSPERTKELKAEYQTRADNEVAIAEYTLKTKLDDYSSFNKTEGELLKDSFDQKKFYVFRDIELSKDQKDQAVKFLDQQYQHELGLIQLAKEQRIFQMQQGLMSANAQSERYWELERIRITRSVQDLEERNQQLAIANALQAEEKRTNLNTAVQQWGGINAEMTGTTDQFNLEKERFDRLDASQALFDAELAMAGENYALKEQAYQAYVDRMIAIENAYQVSSVQLQLGYGEQMASSMSTMMGAIFGEKSKAYAAAFAVEKAFAVAQAALAMGQNIAQASKMGFPYNIPMIAGAMAQGAQIASIISSVAQPTGMAHNGIDNIPKEGTWLLDGGERVLNPQQNKDLTNYLADQRDTYRVGMGTVDAINRGADVQAERQAQASAKAQSANPQPIENNLRVIMVKDEDEAKDWLYNAEGEKAFLYHLKRNRSKI